MPQKDFFLCVNSEDDKSPMSRRSKRSTPSKVGDSPKSKPKVRFERILSHVMPDRVSDALDEKLVILDKSEYETVQLSMVDYNDENLIHSINYQLNNLQEDAKLNIIAEPTS